MKEIVWLYNRVFVSEDILQEQEITDIKLQLERIKQKNMEVFDLLNRQQQLLSMEVDKALYLLNEDKQCSQIKQQDQFDQLAKQPQSSSDCPTSISYQHAQKLSKLKKEIEDILQKISKINNGKGTWYQNDHLDFVKVYNKYVGNQKKIVSEACKILGMKYIEVFDHLETYENYLELEKCKKIVSEQYKQIKLSQQFEQSEKKQTEMKVTQQKLRKKKQKELQENEKKKQLVQKFKQKKQEEKNKCIQEYEQQEKQKCQKRKLTVEKKKQIIQRNQRYIIDKQNKFKQGLSVSKENGKIVHVNHQQKDKLMQNVIGLCQVNMKIIGKNKKIIKDIGKIK